MNDLPYGYEKFTAGARPAKASPFANMRKTITPPPPKFEGPYITAKPFPGVLPSGMAMDSAIVPPSVDSVYAWAQDGHFDEGIGFLGYPYLAQLVQRAEYRRPVEIIAEHSTRNFIELTGTDDLEKTQALYAHLKKFKVQELLLKASEVDSTFGRSHIFIDLGETAGDELAAPLAYTDAKIPKGKLKGLRVIDPTWTYPAEYDAINPLEPSFYRPDTWYVMGLTVHRTRLLPIVARPVPDILKPAYAFGGLSLVQMGKPYVDNWLRNRQSGSDLLNSFSVMALKTDMASMLQGDCTDNLILRAEMFNRFRDNRGLFLLDKESEDFVNVSASLAGVADLVAQAQEQQSSVFGIPLSILLGITPKGLNASTDGELRSFYTAMHAYAERVFREPLEVILKVMQLDLWGEIDPDIGFEFPPLWEMDASERMQIEKTGAEIDAIYTSAGIVDPDEVRERLREDKESIYSAVNLSEPAPLPPEPDFETVDIDDDGLDIETRDG